LEGDTNNSELQEKIEIESNPEILFRKLLNIALDHKCSLALWRLPDQDTIQIILDSEGYDTPEEVDLEVLEKGFIFSPYEEGKQIYIRNHISFTTQSGVLEISADVDSQLKEKVEKVLESVLESGSGKIQTKYYTVSKDHSEDTTKEEYCRTVQQSIEAIKSGVFEKVVPSKTKSLKFKEGFDVIDNFFKLTKAYPHSFVHFVTAPGIGSWIGASPESLIEIEGSKKFRTISLAGTQVVTPDVSTGSVAWTQKEIEEQALVSRYIINCFKKIRLREFEEKGPKTVVAGKLLHLKTIFEVDMEETGFHNLGTVMLKLLHPTSAVCGMPREAANDFLHRVEKHRRRYFCGFIGPVNSSHDTHIFVNLRCMELFENEAILYAGAGVTEDSIPEKEWEETEIKCNTLLDILAGE
jgi:isochorismate synthase